MRASRAKTEAQREPRRWRTPPPILRGADTLEGMEILREVSGDAGLLLWQSYRNVMFWATAPEGERDELFAPEAGRRRLEELLAADLPADVTDPLVAIGRMLGNPAGAAGDTIAEACGAVAQWAESAGHGATALSFIQAAALASPRSAVLALMVGRKARQAGEFPRAETWFRHTIMVARQTGDWLSYARAYLALGNMAIQRGNYPAAHRLHIKSLRAARRKGLTEMQALAAHELFVVATEMGRTAQAEEYARMALRGYGSSHQLLPALAHDVAYYWMNQGYFGRVLPIFQELSRRGVVFPHMTPTADRLLLSAHIARAAGGAGDRSTFRRYWVEVLRLSKEPDAQVKAADALNELAQGASSLGEWDRAEQAASRAMEIALARNEPAEIVRAEWILDSVRSGRQAERNAAHTVVAARSSEALAEQFLNSLASPVGAGV